MKNRQVVQMWPISFTTSSCKQRRSIKVISPVSSSGINHIYAHAFSHHKKMVSVVFGKRAEQAVMWNQMIGESRGETKNLKEYSPRKTHCQKNRLSGVSSQDSEQPPPHDCKHQSHEH
jgi:hypothetical protein